MAEQKVAYTFNDYHIQLKEIKTREGNKSHLDLLREFCDLSYNVCKGIIKAVSRTTAYKHFYSPSIQRRDCDVFLLDEEFRKEINDTLQFNDEMLLSWPVCYDRKTEDFILLIFGKYLNQVDLPSFDTKTFVWYVPSKASSALKSKYILVLSSNIEQGFVEYERNFFACLH